MPIEVLPESTRTLVESARQRMIVHPALELSKFVSWKKGNRGPEADRRASYERVIGSLPRLQSAGESWLARRRSWLAALGDRARTIVVQAKTPCVLWLAAPTPLELGFCLHHTYGLPYLPGSGLKGLARAAMRRELVGIPVVGSGPTRENSNREKKEPPQLLELFGEGGDGGHAGQVDFLDGVPLTASCLELEVMSPHHPKYYQGESKAPHDCEDPVPLPFLRIKPGSQFEIAMVARLGVSDEAAPAALEKAEQYLLLGLEELGVGAKTSSGYGLFARKTGTAATAPAPPSGTQTTAATVERKTIEPAVIASFDLQADRVVFRDQQGNTYEASAQLLERSFQINRNALNQFRRQSAKFRIEVENGKVTAAYKRN
ncbi:MAG: hypothetical protein KatS3mg077_0573 [Candidatus Binatia bacterium]|nr:MAG: hypothetical protein KatS3mg077_0573 [Candidatus Binatia bacterium]